MQAKQPRSDILYMTTLDTGRCSHLSFFRVRVRVSDCKLRFFQVRALLFMVLRVGA